MTKKTNDYKFKEVIMKNKKNFLTFLVILSLVLVSNLYSEQTYQLKTPNFRIETTEDGFHSITIDRFYSYAVPGYPDLPARVYRVALPPDVDPHSIKVNYTIEKTEGCGIYNIKEIPAMRTWVDGQYITGNKADVYTKDDFFPERCIEYAGFSQMRKWRIVTLKYTPFQYNPVTNELRVVSEVNVTIDYQPGYNSDAIEFELHDTVMDRRARKFLMNYEESVGWYESVGSYEPSVTYDYVIITTNTIESTSTKLGDFVTYLSSIGFSPLVITEDEYGGLTGQAPNGTAEKIRKWLQDNYTAYGIEYVLLIGNPDPDDPSSGSDSVGDIPMKMCWPRRTESSYKESPTDYFFADLTGNWDLDGDQYFGEYGDDTGTGGVDFVNEVYVGRIPVYSGVSNLDSVLTKTINYGNSSSTSWRKSALLPMSFSDSTTDGAYLGEAMKNNYLTSNGYSTWTMYMQGSLCSAGDSSFSSNQELLDGATKTRWMNNDYGMVWWWGHGSTTKAYLGFSGCGWGTIMYYTDAPSLDDNHPSFVYQCSCNNGYPESSSNLGTALLYNGAIGTVSASRVSWYAVTSWGTWLKYYCDNASIGYYYGYELAANEKDAGTALYDVKSDMGVYRYNYWGGCHIMNLYDFNLYGDPSAMIPERETISITVTSPNGGENWELGSTQNITWNAAGITGNVWISLFKDGVNLGAIKGNLNASAGSYTWTVGSLSNGTTVSPGSGYTIRVKEQGGGVEDFSDAPFTICGLEVTSPNGGENWQLGSTRNITWNAAGIPGQVWLSLFKDGTNLGAIKGNLDASAGSYTWTVGNLANGTTVSAGSGYTVRVKEQGGGLQDFSDASFTISDTTPSLTLNSPNGGETWELGSAQNITWNATGITGNVWLSLFKDGANLGAIKGNLDASAGTYTWTVGTLSNGTTVSPGSGYTVRVKQQGGGLQDFSDSSFTISGLEVTSPNGGENWQLGSTRNITWNAAGISGQVWLSLFKDGANVGAIIGNLNPAAGSYAWTVGNLSNGTTVSAGSGYTVRVKRQGGGVQDFSDAPFSIYE